MRFYLGPVTRQSFVMILRFAALDGEARIRAVVITGDVIVLQAEEIEGEPKAYVFGAADSQTGGAKFLHL